MAVLVLLTASVPALASGRPVTFSAADGTTLAGLYYEAANRPAPAVVLVHMLGRSKDEWSLIAERLQNAGISVVAMDLRGHGLSGGNGAMLGPMVGDVRAAIDWVSTRPGIRPGALALVGASLGANLVALAAAGAAAGGVAVRAVGLISPSLDYRGVRVDASVMNKLGNRPVWLAASTEDPYALRTVKELVSGSAARELRLSGVRGHGTPLLNADQDLAQALVDWLGRTLIF